MVSLDDPEKNASFASELRSKHVVLSDPLKEAAKAYGVLGFGGLYSKRWTFYIDSDGRIRAIDKSVDVSTAGQDIARTLETLGFPKAGGAS